MFQKKEYIFSETFGVCRVEDITKLNRRNEEQRQYYVLKAIEGGKISYIPVEGHRVGLRPLLSVEEAKVKEPLLDREKQELEWKEVQFLLHDCQYDSP